MRIAFIWPWERATSIFPNWRDGLRATIELIGQTHAVTWFFDGDIPEDDADFDVILFWDDSNSRMFSQLFRYPKAKKGIFLTTDPKNMDNLKLLDVVFCESTPVLEAVRKGGANGVFAFGTDTDFYSPDSTVKKDIEYFYPATFSPWKKQSDIAYLGDSLLCIGTIQPDGYDELIACEKAGVKREVGYFPPEKIRDYYRRTQNIIIPAIHGSERTVLEAMSMNILPEVVNPHNKRTQSYITEYEELKNQNPTCSPREFIEARYSHKIYAENVLKGIS